MDEVKIFLDQTTAFLKNLFHQFSIAGKNSQQYVFYDYRKRLLSSKAGTKKISLKNARNNVFSLGELTRNCLYFSAFALPE